MPIEDHLPLVTPSVAVVLVVERLVEVSHKVHDELQGLRLCGSACCRVPQNREDVARASWPCCVTAKMAVPRQSESLPLATTH